MITRFRDQSLDDVRSIMSTMVREGGESVEVRHLAERIVEGKVDNLSAIFSWVKENYKYQLDPADAELFIHPRRFALDFDAGIIRQGDCDDHALLNSGLLRSLGYSTLILLVDTNRDGEIDHALCLVKTEIGWLPFDTVRHEVFGWQEDWNNPMVIP